MKDTISLMKEQISARRPRGRPVLAAIDGGSAGGKSTLGAALSEALDATLVHMDDFFLPMELRTAQRLSRPGGNVHWERVLEEVLRPLAAGKPLEYGVFDCGTMAISRVVWEEPKGVVIVEGAYSLHPALRDFYDLKIFVTVEEDTQKRRILARNGEAMLRRFLEEWIPLEKAYFAACSVRDCCDIIL